MRLPLFQTTLLIWPVRFFDPLGLQIGDVEDLNAAAEQQEVSKSVFVEMRQRFDGAIGAFAYLLFVLMYIPCASATGTIAREIGLKWAVFIGVWSTLLAYCSATLFYQLGTWWIAQSGSLFLSALAVTVPIMIFLLLKTDKVKRLFLSHKAASYAA